MRLQKRLRLYQLSNAQLFIFHFLSFARAFSSTKVQTDTFTNDHLNHEHGLTIISSFPFFSFRNIKTSSVCLL